MKEGRKREDEKEKNGFWGSLNGRWSFNFCLKAPTYFLFFPPKKERALGQHVLEEGDHSEFANYRSESFAAYH